MDRPKPGQPIDVWGSFLTGGRFAKACNPNIWGRGSRAPLWGTMRRRGRDACDGETVNTAAALPEARNGPAEPRVVYALDANDESGVAARGV
jgi:hypothetical protein